MKFLFAILAVLLVSSALDMVDAKRGGKKGGKKDAKKGGENSTSKSDKESLNIKTVNGKTVISATDDGVTKKFDNVADAKEFLAEN